MPAAEQALAGIGIVAFDHVGDTVTPDRQEATSDLDADMGIALDVAYITSVVTLFGHDPERVAGQTVANWRATALGQLACDGACPTDDRWSRGVRNRGGVRREPAIPGSAG